MSDELDRIAKALKASDVAPDADKKAAAIALARKNFDAHQGIADQARPIHKSAHKASGIWTGVLDMFNSTKLRPALYATTFLIVGGIGFLITQDMTLEDKITASETVQTNALEQDKAMADAVAKEERQNSERRLDDNRGQNAQLEVAAEDMVSKPAPATTESKIAKKTKNSLGTLSGDEAASSQPRTPSFSEAIIIEPSPVIIDKGNETFPDAEPNALKIVSEEPVSTFSIDVDTASYSFVRNTLNGGNLPPANSVRVEELINYFPYDYAVPDVSKAPFSTNVSVFETPWNKDTKLLHIGIQGAKPDVDTRPPLNLVFLIDTSGSMNAPDKLPLLKKSFRLLLSSLRPEDTVGIVTYAGSAGTVLKPTSASNKTEILNSLERLGAGGSTAGQAGLQQAYSLAESMKKDDAIGRVILATDGDFNVGINNPDALKTFVEQKRDTGIYLSVLGFGNGNYRDDMMQTLAQNGNGTAAYIDTLAEAQKVLVDQAGEALFPIANDVKIQVEFNPEKIAEYRLIGYETRALSREDFNNDQVDAGEIGAGHTVTAIYEITPVGSPAVKNTPLRYQSETVAANDSNELGFLKLRYKKPSETVSKLISTPIPQSNSTPNAEAKFATAIAGMGQMLAGTKYLGDWNWDQNIALALEGKGVDQFGYRAEAIQLMRLAKSLK